MSNTEFPIKSGYAQFDRRWLLHKDSPFAGKNHRRHYLIWQHLCLFSTYQPMDGLGTGEFKTTTRELADYCSQSQKAVRNALAFLVSHGLIELVSTSRHIHTRITHYDDISEMPVFMGKCKTGNLGYSNSTGINNLESLEKTTVFESRVLNRNLWYSKGTQTEQEITVCNYGENMGKKKAGYSKGTQKTPLLKEYKNKDTTTLKSSSRLALRRKPPRQPTEDEVQLAAFWNSVISKHTRSNLLTDDEQVTGLVDFLEKTKVELQLVREVLTWAQANKYWRSEVRCLSSLLLPYRREKSVKRFQAMCDDMDYQSHRKEETTKVEAKPKKWIGELV